MPAAGSRPPSPSQHPSQWAHSAPSLRGSRVAASGNIAVRCAAHELASCGTEHHFAAAAPMAAFKKMVATSTAILAPAKNCRFWQVRANAQRLLIIDLASHYLAKQPHLRMCALRNSIRQVQSPRQSCRSRFPGCRVSEVPPRPLRHKNSGP